MLNSICIWNSYTSSRVLPIETMFDISLIEEKVKKKNQINLCEQSSETI